MNEIEPRFPETSLVINPTTGEVLDVSNPVVAAEFLDNLRLVKEELNRTIAAVTDVVEREMVRQGTQTLHVGPWTLERSSGDKYAWDEEVLQELRDPECMEGVPLPEERYLDLVQTTVSVKVSQTEAKKISAINPIAATIIERARTVVPGRPRISVKKGRIRDGS